MYYRFKIGEEALRGFIQSAECIDVGQWANPNYTDVHFISNKNNIKGIVSALSIGDKYIVDGGEIQNRCFATKLPEEFHIFVSHSHADINLIEQFAIVMKRVFGVSCFVDSMVWEKKDEILAVLNEPNITEKIDGVITRYAHEPVIRTTDHVHAMLSMALMEMIDRCEMCLFVHSDNSVLPTIKTNDFKEETLSAWIYEEISMMNRIRLNPIEDRPLVEAREFDKDGRHIDAHREYRITHPLDLRNFVELNRYDLPLNERGTRWLDTLYANVLNKQIL